MSAEGILKAFAILHSLLPLAAGTDPADISPHKDNKILPRAAVS